ncbi:MAG TPA: class I SAM-dependent methyltransferase [Acidobacteriaceae bacterium]|nr:class I SAM-dependent methyltransferase [Acidobacteriaceae bacterium]
MAIENLGAKYSGPLRGEDESLFERCSWLYAFCREHLFRDHTAAISDALWPDAQPGPETHLLEIACGPGFYACSLAERFPDIRITGVDLSQRLLSRAKVRADVRRLTNCHFVRANVLTLSESLGPVDAIVASRLLMVVGDRHQALREIFSSLRPGGRCFIAEPTSALRAALPLSCMWLFARLMGDWSTRFHESGRGAVMKRHEFQSLIASQPWSSVSVWQDHWYQYAVCDRSF